jgi:hypothetical protein
MKRSILLTAAIIGLAPTALVPVRPAFADVVDRIQEVRPLPGALNDVLMVNDNNPELIREEGILLSTFPGSHPSGLKVTLNGRFDLFSHHVYAGNEESLDSTLWLAVLAAPIDNPETAGGQHLAVSGDPPEPNGSTVPSASLHHAGIRGHRCSWSWQSCRR